MRNKYIGFKMGECYWSVLIRPRLILKPELTYLSKWKVLWHGTNIGNCNCQVLRWKEISIGDETKFEICFWHGAELQIRFQMSELGASPIVNLHDIGLLSNLNEQNIKIKNTILILPLNNPIIFGFVVYEMKLKRIE